MRPLFYVSLMVLGWAISLSLADFPNFNPANIPYYSDCFLDRGPCGGDSRALKRLLPDFIATSCARCNDNLKKEACRILSILLMPQYNELWSELVHKYDPVGQHQVKLAEFKLFCSQKYGVSMPV